MRYDHASLYNVRRNFVQAGRDVFIRKPMKSVPPDAFAIELFRYCVVIDNSTVRTVECRIETGDLSQSGPKREQGPYHRQIVGLMQRCKRNIPLQARKHVFVDQNRPVIVRAAMNDAMTDRGKLYARGLAQPFGGDRGSRRHIGDFGRCIRLIDQGGPARRFRAQARPRANSVHLSF